MIDEFSLSYSLVGMLAMGYRLSAGALQLLMGFLGRFVRRKFLLGFAMMWQCVFNLLTSFAQGFDQVFLSRTLAGVGSSPQHPTGASYIAENIPKVKRGRAMGMNNVAGQIGNFATPLLGSLILVTVGWRNTMLLFSIPGVLVGVFFLLVKEPRHSEQWSGTQSLSVLFRGVRDVLSNKAVIAVMILETVMAFRMGARDFLPSYFVESLKMGSLDAGIVFTLFVASGVPAPYLWGFLSDKLGRMKVLIFAMGTTAAAWLLLSYQTSTAQLISVLLVIGVCGQGSGGVIQAFVADSTSSENRDLVYGIYFTVSFGLGGLSPGLLGYITDEWGFQANFRWVALVSFLAVIAAAILLRRAPSQASDDST